VAVYKLAASEAILALRDQITGGAGRYHICGYGRVAEVCADLVEAKGGRYLTKTRVQQILVEDGQLTGVEINGESGSEIIRAKTVISSAGIQPTVLKLAGEQHFPAGYVERVKFLEPSWAIAGYRYVLDKRIFDSALIPVFSDQSWLDSERFAKNFL
jgi:phytoene dehydrogenase-like protein